MFACVDKGFQLLNGKCRFWKNRCENFAFWSFSLYLAKISHRDYAKSVVLRPRPQERLPTKVPTIVKPLQIKVRAILFLVLVPANGPKSPFAKLAFLGIWYIRPPRAISCSFVSEILLCRFAIFPSHVFGESWALGCLRPAEFDFGITMAVDGWWGPKTGGWESGNFSHGQAQFEIIGKQ